MEKALQFWLQPDDRFFSPRIIEKIRRRNDLDRVIGEMFVAGASQACVGQVIETLTGTKPSASTVSRVFDT